MRTTLFVNVTVYVNGSQDVLMEGLYLNSGSASLSGDVIEVKNETGQIVYSLKVISGNIDLRNFILPANYSIESDYPMSAYGEALQEIKGVKR